MRLQQAFGIAASLWSPSLAGFVVGSLLLGAAVYVWMVRAYPVASR